MTIPAAESKQQHFRWGVDDMSNLKQIRKTAGLTQFQLAARANISRFRLCMAETGNIELRPQEIAAITEAVKPELERTTRLASEFTGAMAAISA